MKSFIATAAAVVLLAIGIPMTASAGGEDLANGVNGILTAPMDLVHGVVEPKRLVDVGQLHESLGVVNVVTDRIGGFVFGVYTMLKRLGFGILDTLTFPLTEEFAGPYSPEARYRVIGAVTAE